jgi:hypothetical protein
LCVLITVRVFLCVCVPHSQKAAIKYDRDGAGPPFYDPTYQTTAQCAAELAQETATCHAEVREDKKEKKKTQKGGRANRP